jgi:tetratricopeptide (TPR) repeat protein
MMRWVALGLALTLAVGCGKSGPATDPTDAGHRREVEAKPGDTWASLAETFFADPARAEALARENGQLVEVEPIPGSVVVIRVTAADMDRVRRLERARDPYNLGTEHLREGRLEAAESAFREALDLAPEFMDARYNLGLVALESGRPDAALGHLVPVAAARPRDKDAQYALGAAYYHRGDFQAAELPLRAAIDLDPGFLRARFTWAMCLEQVGRLAEAREAWQEYLRRDSSSAWAREARSHLEQLP